MPDEDVEDEQLFETLVGTKLSEAREAKGMELDEIAKSTRIPLRQLQNIENADYDALPAPTYAVGFVKAYAREVGLDQNALARQFREEISYRPRSEAHTEYFEPTDPARVPPRGLAWIAAAIAIVLVVGYLIWRSGVFDGSMSDRARLAAEGGNAESAEAAGSVGGTTEAAPDPASATGPVVLEAEDTVWLRVYDMESGDRIFESELAPGDTYTVPADAAAPAIRTGRADALRVTVGGRRVAPIGPPQTIISDVSLLPRDLVGRRAASANDGDERSAADSGGGGARPGFSGE
ncbi:helix-turn-helix domain-containing protein [uncultured Parasphingopyxis sp.]|uniref:helix-turn-helix domain-containing protein n=1 Tax=uncultured Parasphingopyxis sp. TaxID=1547918 RepID=UPI00261FB429|nr:helix-turn-helix domain-containing protein [uncultured Parasphingopyxis sp.]